MSQWVVCVCVGGGGGGGGGGGYAGIRHQSPRSLQLFSECQGFRTMIMLASLLPQSAMRMHVEYVV